MSEEIKTAGTGRKRLEGKVISDKSAKTRVVLTEQLRRHKSYGKVQKYRKKYYAHDEKEISRTGDAVTIEEMRPMSKLKRWRILSVKGQI